MSTTRPALANYRTGSAATEPTGRYHRLAHNRLTADGLAVTLVNPDRSRQFAKATGKLAKTDSVAGGWAWGDPLVMAERHR